MAGDDLLTQAQNEFPILKNMELLYKMSPKAQQGYLEFWPADERGSQSWQRPTEFPLGKMGVEVYDPRTRPIDIMGDVASHHLVQTDPRMKAYYQSFEQSLTEEQKTRLQEQYRYAQKHEGEKRPYQQWYQSSGLPGYFRGYPFQQWENPKEIYTPQQLQMFDEMMSYLRKK